MGVITIEHMDALYWLGRYSERVYTTIRLYCKSYDQMIDQNLQDYQKFCESLEIPNIYESSDVFKKRYPFDTEDPNSIISNLTRAYDNAIILREEIGSETLSYIQLALYSMQKAKLSNAPMIEMMSVMDNILAFWGIADDSIDSEQVRNIIKTGKRVERIDLYSRLKMERKELLRELHRLIPRIAKSGIKYNPKVLNELDVLIHASEIDYHTITGTVESILEV